MNNILPVEKGRDSYPTRIDPVKYSHLRLWTITLPSDVLRQKIVSFRNSVVPIYGAQFV